MRQRLQLTLMCCSLRAAPACLLDNLLHLLRIDCKAVCDWHDSVIMRPYRDDLSG